MSGSDPAAGSVSFGEVDRDGALLEHFAQVYGESRASLLRRAALGSAAVVAVLVGADEVAAAGGGGDTDILNFDLAFEYLQSSFYLSAVKVGTVAKMAAPKQRWARVLGAHELAHVRILRSVLGARAVKKPFFDFHGVTENESSFIRTAVAMEDLTVALLAGQAARFRNRALIPAVFSLLTVEARHAAWARRISGYLPVGQALDQPKSLDEVDHIVASTHFLASRPQTLRSGGTPPFTG